MANGNDTQSPHTRYCAPWRPLLKREGHPWTSQYRHLNALPWHLLRNVSSGALPDWDLQEHDPARPGIFGLALIATMAIGSGCKDEKPIKVIRRIRYSLS